MQGRPAASVAFWLCRRWARSWSWRSSRAGRRRRRLLLPPHCPQPRMHLHPQHLWCPQQSQSPRRQRCEQLRTRVRTARRAGWRTARLRSLRQARLPGATGARAAARCWGAPPAGASSASAAASAARGLACTAGRSPAGTPPTAAPSALAWRRRRPQVCHCAFLSGLYMTRCLGRFKKRDTERYGYASAWCAAGCIRSHVYFEHLDGTISANMRVASACNQRAVVAPGSELVRLEGWSFLYRCAWRQHSEQGGAGGGPQTIDPPLVQARAQEAGEGSPTGRSLRASRACQPPAA